MHTHENVVQYKFLSGKCKQSHKEVLPHTYGRLYIKSAELRGWGREGEWRGRREGRGEEREDRICMFVREKCQYIVVTYKPCNKI